MKKEIQILEMNGEPDHIHILFECGPEISQNVLKTRSAGSVRRDLLDEYIKIRKIFSTNTNAIRGL